MTDKELIVAFRRAPGAATFRPIISRYIWFVFNSVARQLPTVSEPQVRQITLAVLQALANRLRALPPRTLLASWLFHAAQFAVKKVCRRQGMKPSGKKVPSLDECLQKLPRKNREAILYKMVLGLSWTDAAAHLRISPPRAKKRVNAALKRVVRQYHRWNVTPEEVGNLFVRASASSELIPTSEPHSDAPPILNANADLEAFIAAETESSFKKVPKEAVVRSILAQFTWLKWKRRFSVVASLVGLFLVGALTVAASGVLLWKSGHLLPIIFRIVPRLEARGIPELRIPSKPWTPPGGGLSAAALRSANELYQKTNIWSAHLSFTREQWKRIQPSRISPVKNLIGGEDGIVLHNPKARRNGLAGALGINFEWTEANLTFSGMTFTNVGARYKGNGTYVSSLWGPKQSFKVDLNRLEKEQELAGLTTINFVNEVEDVSYMRDSLGHELFRESGVPASRTAYAYLTLTAGGYATNKALGLYLLTENVDGNFAKANFSTKKAPIFKPVTHQLFEDIGSSWKDYEAIYDLKTKATEEQKARVIEFCKLVSHASDEAFARQAPEFLDFTEFARFVACISLIASYDGFLSNGQNFYVYLDPRSNKFGFIPWDMDHAWGAFPFVGDSRSRELASIMHPWAQKRFLFLERVMGLEEFRKIYREEIKNILDRSFSPEKLNPKIDELARMLHDSVAAESAFRLKRFEQSTADKWDPAIDQEPKRPANVLKIFIEHRSKSARDQIEGRSKGILPGKNALGP